MATRGCVGVVQGDTFRGVYNHWDSYSQGLGIEYIYLIDPVKEELVVVCTYTGKEVKIPIKKILKRKVNWNYVARRLI